MAEPDTPDREPAIPCTVNPLRRWLATIPFIPLCFLGQAAYRAWLNVAFSKDIFGAGPAFFVSQNAFDITITLAMIICMLVARQLTPLYAKLWPRLVCAGLMLAASVLGFLPLWGPSSPQLLLASTILGGAGTTLAILLWGELYGRLTPVRICLYYSAAQAVATGLSWMYEGFRLEWLPVMVPLLPLASMAFLTDCYRAEPASDASDRPWARFSFPWKPVLVIAVYSFAYGLMQSSFSSVMRPVMSIGTAACALAVVGAIVILRRWLGFEGIYGTLLPVMAAAALLLATMGELSPDWRNFFANWGHTASSIFITTMLGSICYHWGVSAVWLFAIESIVTTPAQIMGRLVDGWVMSTDASSIGAAPLVIVMVLVATVVVLRECRLSSSWGVELTQEQPATERSRAVEERAALMRACSTMATSYGLSQREEEVLLLLAQHKSAGDIGTELCVAHGTAKAHIRHVYQKLDVHTREELFDLVEEEKSSKG